MLDVYVGYLRKKTEAGGEARLIQTVRGRRLRAARRDSISHVHPATPDAALHRHPGAHADRFQHNPLRDSTGELRQSRPTWCARLLRCRAGRSGPPRGPTEGLPSPPGLRRATRISSRCPDAGCRPILDGEVIARSRDLSETSLPLSAEGLRAVTGGATGSRRPRWRISRLLIYSRSFPAPTATPRSCRRARRSPRRYNRYARCACICSSAAACHRPGVRRRVGAGRARRCRPVDHITRTAQAIGAEHDFSRRVEHKGPRDEIGQLAVTLNDMLPTSSRRYRQLRGGAGIAAPLRGRCVARAAHALDHRPR